MSEENKKVNKMIDRAKKFCEGLEIRCCYDPKGQYLLSEDVYKAMESYHKKEMERKLAELEESIKHERFVIRNATDYHYEYVERCRKIVNTTESCINKLRE